MAAHFMSVLSLPCLHYPGNLGSVSFSITYFLSKKDIMLCILGRKCFKNHIDPEAQQMFRKRAIILWRAGGPQVGRVAFPQKAPNHLVAMAMELAPLSLLTQQLLCDRRGFWISLCGSSHPHTLRVGQWVPWDLFLMYVDTNVKNSPSGSFLCGSAVNESD